MDGCPSAQHGMPGASSAGAVLTLCCGCRFKLGRVLWELGGTYREDPDQAQTQFESASMEECDSQVHMLLPLLLLLCRLCSAHALSARALIRSLGAMCLLQKAAIVRCKCMLLRCWRKAVWWTPVSAGIVLWH